MFSFLLAEIFKVHLEGSRKGQIPAMWVLSLEGPGQSVNPPQEWSPRAVHPWPSSGCTLGPSSGCTPGPPLAAPLALLWLHPWALLWLHPWPCPGCTPSPPLAAPPGLPWDCPWGIGSGGLTHVDEVLPDGGPVVRLRPERVFVLECCHHLRNNQSRLRYVLVIQGMQFLRDFSGDSGRVCVGVSVRVVCDNK